MIKGTTVAFKFDLPCEFSELTDATIYFWQKRYAGTAEAPLPITKTKTHCTASSSKQNELIVILSDEETNRFTEKEKGYVQLQGKTKSAGATAETVFASRQKMFTVYPLYNPMDKPEPLPDSDGYIILDGESI